MPNDLPGELTRFIGRHTELVQIGGALGGARLLTLTGAGGSGKTRLALQAAAEGMDRHPDGVWWVELARLEDATLLPAAVLGTLGLREVPGWSLLDTLVRHLRARCALVVLDKCEHLLAACAVSTHTAIAKTPSCPSRPMVSSGSDFPASATVCNACSTRLAPWPIISPPAPDQPSIRGPRRKCEFRPLPSPRMSRPSGD